MAAVLGQLGPLSHPGFGKSLCRDRWRSKNFVLSREDLCVVPGGTASAGRAVGFHRPGCSPDGQVPVTDPFSLPLQGQGGQAQTLCFETIITVTWAAWERSLVSRMQVCGSQALEPLLPVAVPRRQPSPQPLQRPTPCSHAPHTQIHTHPHTYTHAHPIRVKTPNHTARAHPHARTNTHRAPATIELDLAEANAPHSNSWGPVGSGP